jgi:hypothetical protein
MALSKNLDLLVITPTRGEILLKIELYPNPSNGMVYLSVENNNSIKNMEVFNAQGELILIQSSKNNHLSQLDLRSQSNGLYLLKIYTINGIVIKRFSIAK